MVFCALRADRNTPAGEDLIRRFAPPSPEGKAFFVALREDNDLTQTQVALYLGTSQTMYARYECGASFLPGSASAVRSSRRDGSPDPSARREATV